MNALFLDRYCTYHLEDIGMMTSDNLLEFKGQCTEFLKEIKEIDIELYRDVMTMSAPKQSTLMKNIYTENHTSFDDLISELAKYDQSFADALKSDIDDILKLEAQLKNGEITEASLSLGKLFNVGKAIIKWFNNTIKTTLAEGGDYSTIIGGLLIALSSAGAVIYLLPTVLSTFILAPLLNLVGTIAVIAALTVLILTPISFGKNATTLGGVIISQFKKLVLSFNEGKKIQDFSSKGTRAIALLLRTDMSSCLNSNISEGETTIARDIKIFNLFNRDRGIEPGFTPAEISADNILKCSLTYLTNTIAEMYSSLSQCQINTKKHVSVPSSFTSLSPELSKLDLAPECQSIRETLDNYVIYFNELLSLTFKSDVASQRYWKAQLDTNIKAVMGGRHANPIKNASRGVPKRLSKVRFKFDRTPNN